MRMQSYNFNPDNKYLIGQKIIENNKKHEKKENDESFYFCKRNNNFINNKDLNNLIDKIDETEIIIFEDQEGHQINSNCSINFSSFENSSYNNIQTKRNKDNSVTAFLTSLNEKQAFPFKADDVGKKVINTNSTSQNQITKKTDFNQMIQQKPIFDNLVKDAKHSREKIIVENNNNNFDNNNTTNNPMNILNIKFNTLLNKFVSSTKSSQQNIPNNLQLNDKNNLLLKSYEDLYSRNKKKINNVNKRYTENNINFQNKNPLQRQSLNQLAHNFNNNKIYKTENPNLKNTNSNSNINLTDKKGLISDKQINVNLKTKSLQNLNNNKDPIYYNEKLIENITAKNNFEKFSFLDENKLNVRNSIKTNKSTSVKKDQKQKAESLSKAKEFIKSSNVVQTKLSQAFDKMLVKNKSKESDKNSKALLVNNFKQNNKIDRDHSNSNNSKNLFIEKSQEKSLSSNITKSNQNTHNNLSDNKSCFNLNCISEETIETKILNENLDSVILSEFKNTQKITEQKSNYEFNKIKNNSNSIGVFNFDVIKNFKNKIINQDNVDKNINKNTQNLNNKNEENLNCLTETNINYPSQRQLLNNDYNSNINPNNELDKITCKNLKLLNLQDKATNNNYHINNNNANSNKNQNKITNVMLNDLSKNTLLTNLKLNLEAQNKKTRNKNLDQNLANFKDTTNTLTGKTIEKGINSHTYSANSPYKIMQNSHYKTLEEISKVKEISKNKHKEYNNTQTGSSNTNANNFTNKKESDQNKNANKPNQKNFNINLKKNSNINLKASQPSLSNNNPILISNITDKQNPSSINNIMLKSHIVKNAKIKNSFHSNSNPNNFHLLSNKNIISNLNQNEFIERIKNHSTSNSYNKNFNKNPGGNINYNYPSELKSSQNKSNENNNLKKNQYTSSYNSLGLNYNNKKNLESGEINFLKNENYLLNKNTKSQIINLNLNLNFNNLNLNLNSSSSKNLNQNNFNKNDKKNQSKNKSGTTNNNNKENDVIIKATTNKGLNTLQDSALNKDKIINNKINDEKNCNENNIFNCQNIDSLSNLLKNALPEKSSRNKENFNNIISSNSAKFCLGNNYSKTQNKDKDINAIKNLANLNCNLTNNPPILNTNFYTTVNHSNNNANKSSNINNEYKLNLKGFNSKQQSAIPISLTKNSIRDLNQNRLLSHENLLLKEPPEHLIFNNNNYNQQSQKIMEGHKPDGITSNDKNNNFENYKNINNKIDDLGKLFDNSIANISYSKEISYSDLNLSLKNFKNYEKSSCNISNPNINNTSSNGNIHYNISKESILINNKIKSQNIINELSSNILDEGENSANAIEEITMKKNIFKQSNYNNTNQESIKEYNNTKMDFCMNKSNEHVKNQNLFINSNSNINEKSRNKISSNFSKSTHELCVDNNYYLIKNNPLVINNYFISGKNNSTNVNQKPKKSLFTAVDKIQPTKAAMNHNEDIKASINISSKEKEKKLNLLNLLKIDAPYNNKHISRNKNSLVHRNSSEKNNKVKNTSNFLSQINAKSPNTQSQYLFNTDKNKSSKNNFLTQNNVDKNVMLYVNDINKNNISNSKL